MNLIEAIEHPTYARSRKMSAPSWAKTREDYDAVPVTVYHYVDGGYVQGVISSTVGEIRPLLAERGLVLFEAR